MSGRSENYDEPIRYGGQAVLEGVMMRNTRRMAVAVRSPQGEILVRTRPLNPALYAGWPARVPLVRGLVMLWDALGLGIGALMWSADVAMGEEARGTAGRVAEALGLFLGLALAVGLFMVLPSLLAGLLPLRPYPAADALTEGLIRLGLLVGYLWAVGRLPEIRRVFAYHGAEHKAINAYEAGAPLTVEALRPFPTAHTRCGTSFLLGVVLLSVLLLAPLGPLPPPWRAISRLLAIPLIAGLAYEGIRLGARYGDRPWMRWLVGPGLALQRLTTREPDDEMLEVALRALQATMDETE